MSSGIESEAENQSQITGATTSVIPTDSHDRNPSKKRKTILRWTKQVPEQTEQEGTLLDDGFNWRKYGMNYVFGARYPRCPKLIVSSSVSEGLFARHTPVVR